MNILAQGRTLVAGVAIIVIVNAIALGGVGYNRSGSPDSTLHLSQRELSESWQRDDENSGIALTLKWRVPVRFADEKEWQQGYYGAFGHGATWLDAAKLKSLGFDATPPVAAADALQGYQPQPRREVLLVMELDGTAYQQSLAQTRRFAASAATDIPAATYALAREERESSRLFVVDAGLDAKKLRVKYPDRSHYAIVRGTIRPQWMNLTAKPYLSGSIEQLSINTINVPVAFRPIFVNKTGNMYTAENAPPFEAVVAFGKRFEPWIVEARGE